MLTICIVLSILLVASLVAHVFTLISLFRAGESNEYNNDFLMELYEDLFKVKVYLSNLTKKDLFLDNPELQRLIRYMRGLEESIESYLRTINILIMRDDEETPS